MTRGFRSFSDRGPMRSAACHCLARRWECGRFWMCDWLAGEVLAFNADGDREVVARVNALPFSIDWLPDGRLVTTTSNGVVVGTELAPYGATGQPFNEIVVDRAGRAGVNMPGAPPARNRGPIAGASPACSAATTGARSASSPTYDGGSNASGGIVLTQLVDVAHAGRP